MLAYQRSVKWEKVYIFISSTFNDMHAERDFLVKKVFPQLAEWCERRKLRMVDIDLRWGVTEEDATRNRNVVEVCLNRIDECRPFFLCFLGQRYGWVPKREREKKDISDETLKQFPGLEQAVDAQHSVTELEILHALVKPFHSQDLLREKNYYPAKYALFFLRDSSYLKDIPSEPAYLRRVYTDEAETDLRKRDFLLQKNKRLRENTVPGIKRPVFSYQATWSDKERSPELEIPLQCPAMLQENIARWKRQWLEAADVSVSGLNVLEDPQEEKQAREFNEKVTQGRLINFKTEGEPFDEIMLRSLKEVISERFPDHVAVKEADELQSELDQQEQFLFINSEGFIEREGDFEQLDSYLRNDSNKLFVLAAPGGMGKTTLLANWIDRYHSRNEGSRDDSIHFRFIGQSDRSTTVPNLLHYLLRELQEVARKIPASTTGTRETPDGGKEIAEVPLEIPQDPIKLREAWPNLLETVGQHGKTILVLDALNQLESGLSDTRWLPSKLPENVKLIVSFKLGEETAEELLERFREGENVHLSEVKPFKDRKHRHRLVRAYLSQYLKELDEQHLEELIRSPGAENPLYLKVVLSELRVFGAFANLGEKVRKDFGDTPISAFDGVLSRLERDPAYSPLETEQSVPLLFGLLAHARHGLSADELASLFILALNLKDNRESREAAVNTVYLFLRQVRFFIARRDGRYDFFFESFRNAAFRKYVATGKDKLPKRTNRGWHKILSDYFYYMVDPACNKTWKGEYPRGLSELPYHLIKGEQFKKVSALLTDCIFLEKKATCHSLFNLLEDYRQALAVLPEKEGELSEQRSIIKAFSTAVNQASFILIKHPYLMFPQIYNRLQWRTEKNKELKERLAVERARYQKPWLCFLNEPVLGSALIRVFSGHTGHVQACAFSPDGQCIASASNDGTLRLWTAETGEELAIFKGHTQELMTCAFSPDGQKIASGGLEIKLWDVESGQNLMTLEGHVGGVMACTFSPDGRFIASAGGAPDPTIKLWDVNTGKRIITMGDGNAYQNKIHDCAFTLDSLKVVAANWDKTLSIWDVETGKKKAIFKGHNGEVNACALHPDGSRIVSASEDGMLKYWHVQLKFWHVKKCTHLSTIRGSNYGLTSCALSFDGRRIISADSAGILRLWDSESGRELAIFEGHTARVTDCAFSPDGRQIVSASWDGTLNLWDTEIGQHSYAGRKRMGMVNKYAFSPDGQTIVSANADNTLRLWESGSGKEIGTLRGHTDSVSKCDFSEDGKVIVSFGSSWDQSMKLWHAKSGEEITSLDFGEVTKVSTISPDLRCVAFTGLTSAVKLLRTDSSDKFVTLTGHTDFVNDCAFSPDSKHIVSASKDKTLRIWDVDSGTEIIKLSGQMASVHRCVFSPDGRRIAAITYKRLKVWDAKNGEGLATFRIHREYIDRPFFLSFSPDGKVICALYDEKTLMLCDAGNNEKVTYLEGHTDWVTACAFSADGKLVASCSHDKTVIIWGADSGKEIATLRGLTDVVIAASFGPGGRRIVLGERGGNILLVALENIPQSFENVRIWPAIVTSYEQSNKLFYRCHYCLEVNQVKKLFLGKQAICSVCGEVNKLNPFIIKQSKIKNNFMKHKGKSSVANEGKPSKTESRLFLRIWLNIFSARWRAYWEKNIKSLKDGFRDGFGL